MEFTACLFWLGFFDFMFKRLYEAPKYSVIVLVLMFISRLFLQIQAYRIKRRLLSFDKVRWIDFGWQFNNWDFPIEFYDLIPYWYRYGSHFKSGSKLIRPLMREIDKNFSNKEQLRHHNVLRGRMTDEQFNFWYDTCSLSNAYRNSKEDSWDNFYFREKGFKQIEWWKDEVYESLEKCGFVKGVNEVKFEFCKSNF